MLSLRKRKKSTKKILIENFYLQVKSAVRAVPATPSSRAGHTECCSQEH